MPREHTSGFPNKRYKTTMIEKVLSTRKRVVVLCSIVYLILLNGKLAAEPNQTDFMYSIGFCDPQNTDGHLQVNCEGMNKKSDV